MDVTKWSCICLILCPIQRAVALDPRPVVEVVWIFWHAEIVSTSSSSLVPAASCSSPCIHQLSSCYIWAGCLPPPGVDHPTMLGPGGPCSPRGPWSPVWPRGPGGPSRPGCPSCPGSPSRPSLPRSTSMYGILLDVIFSALIFWMLLCDRFSISPGVAWRVYMNNQWNYISSKKNLPVEVVCTWYVLYFHFNSITLSYCYVPEATSNTSINFKNDSQTVGRIQMDVPKCNWIRLTAGLSGCAYTSVYQA